MFKLIDRGSCIEIRLDNGYSSDAYDHEKGMDESSFFHEPTMELAFHKMKLQLVHYGFGDYIIDFEFKEGWLSETY